MRPGSLRCRLVRWTFVVLLVACARLVACAPAPAPAPIADAPVREAPADAERYYAIWLGGAQIGTAHETEQWSSAGVVVRRTEAMSFLRGEVPVALATTIEITANRRLAPSLVTWTEHAQTLRHGQAARGATGWIVTDEAGVRRLPREAIPAELVPLLVRRDGRFAGGVFLPARGFAAGSGRIDPIAPNRLVARLVLDAGAAAPEPANPVSAPAEATGEATAEATIDLGPDAMPIRVVDGEGVIATRITGAQAAVAFEPVDLIAATSIPLSGTPSERIVLQLERGLAIPPDDVELELSAQLPGGLPPGPRGADRTRAIASLVAEVRERIVPDLAATPTSARTAAVAISGDCTTFALSYAALAIARAIPTRVVTGFRVDGDRLIRHRWAVSWTGRTWIAVDAAFDAVPAGGDLVGVAIHDADDAGLVAGEAALTHVRAATWN